MLLSSLLNYIALLFEFIGVFLITKGFWSITSQDIESASSTFVGENIYIARSLIFQKIDGQYGGILLMIGIVFMFVASFVDKAQKSNEHINITFGRDSVLDNLHFSSVEGMNIFRITQEAVNNAMKYSGAQNITLNAKKIDNQIKIQQSYISL